MFLKKVSLLPTTILTRYFNKNKVSVYKSPFIDIYRDKCITFTSINFNKLTFVKANFAFIEMNVSYYGRLHIINYIRERKDRQYIW